MQADSPVMLSVVSVGDRRMEYVRKSLLGICGSAA